MTELGTVERSRMQGSIAKMRAPKSCASRRQPCPAQDSIAALSRVESSSLVRPQFRASLYCWALRCVVAGSLAPNTPRNFSSRGSSVSQLQVGRDSRRSQTQPAIPELEQPLPREATVTTGYPMAPRGRPLTRTQTPKALSGFDRGPTLHPVSPNFPSA